MAVPFESGASTGTSERRWARFIDCHGAAFEFLAIHFCNSLVPALLHFHESKRNVATASYDQVRRPLYAGSIGYSAKYERHLEPLRKALVRGGVNL